MSATRSRRAAKNQGPYVWIVMSLLLGSTGLALYDLYLLMTIVAIGA